jgi:subtilisin family serine protease
VLAAVNGTFAQTLSLPNAFVIHVPAGTEEQAASSLAADPNVLYAEPNRIAHAYVVPNDTSFGQLWGLRNLGQTVGGQAGTADADIDAPEGWQIGLNLVSSVRVAVIDTGATVHPDFLPNIFKNPGESGGGKEANGVDDDHNGFVDDVAGWDFVNNDNIPLDDNSHGSHVSGTIAGRSNNAAGVAGVASFPRASGQWAGPKIVPIKVLDAAGSGSFVQIAAGMNYAGKIGAKVANMSLGGAGTSAFLDDTIRHNPKVLFVVAAGNDAQNNDFQPHTPCVPASATDLPNKICVAATDNRDNLASFSNFGVKNVDLAAPGVAILSTVPVASTLFSDNFETAIAGRWVTNDAGQKPAAPRWSQTSEFAFSPTRSITDSAGANYVNNQNNWIRNASGLDFRNRVGCRVKAPFDLRTGDNNDRFNIDATRTPATLASWANRESWFGNGQASLNLPLGFDGQNGVFLRFRMTSDAANVADGVHVDDVQISCFKLGNVGFALFNGTSMATPHVAGAAAFLFTKFPTATVAQIKDKLLRSVDKKPSLSGKVLTGGRLNLYKAAAESTAAITGTGANRVLTFNAGTGETNNVIVTRIGSGAATRFQIADRYSTSAAAVQSGSRINPGAGCARASDNVVRCLTTGVSRIVLNGGDLNDTLDAATIVVPVTLNGGDGNDGLFGGKNADSFSGGLGNDNITTKDDINDVSIVCGAGADTVNADLTPNETVAADCETVHRT